MEHRLKYIDWPREGTWRIETHGVTQMDTSGAWLLLRVRDSIQSHGGKVQLRDVVSAHRELMNLVDTTERSLGPSPERPLHWVQEIGRWCVSTAAEMIGFLSFVGEMTLQSVRLSGRVLWRRMDRIFAEVQSAGVAAMPIIMLLSFLVGVTLAYQSTSTLTRYGAGDFLVPLVALSVLREMGPLITAVIVAGRTGSAFTAQIGTMRITEEIDALRSLGITAYEMLVIPKLIAMLIAVPLLTVLADIAGLFGGMVIGRVVLDISYLEFLTRLADVVRPSTYWQGIIKAPVFALIITAVGCFHGFRVTGSAESVGIATTRSVVQGIFLVICADAVFSVVFSFLGY